MTRASFGVDPVRHDRHHTAARGGITTATLAFVRGAYDIHIEAEPAAVRLFTARFAGRQPAVSTSGATVRIRYWPGLTPRGRGDITLNPEVNWAIRVDGGVGGLDADLTRLRLSSIDIYGGASQVTLRLPRLATGKVPVRISGGASRVTIRRPTGTGACLHISRGAAQLTFDAQHFRAIGGGLQLASSSETTGAGHYDIDIGSGASRVTVTNDNGEEG